MDIQLTKSERRERNVYIFCFITILIGVILLAIVLLPIALGLIIGYFAFYWYFRGLGFIGDKLIEYYINR